MKKIISAIIAASLILAYFCTFGVLAAEEPTIYYSIDKSKWYILPASNFTGEVDVKFADGNTKRAKVYMEDGVQGVDILDENVQFVYFYAEAPEGTTCDFYTAIDSAQDQEPWKNLVDGGIWAWEAESVYAKIPVKVSNSVDLGDGPKTAISVPLRLGRVEVFLECKGGETDTLYKASINGRWTAVANNPTLSNTLDGFRVYTGCAAGYAIMMPGASVANDNQTYLYTYSKYRLKDAATGSNPSTNSLWIGANFSKWLEGSSYVMMPGHGIVGSRDTYPYNDVTKKFFDISTEKSYSWASGNKKVEGKYGDGYIGEVVVLMAYRADEKSEYYKSGSGWECVNNGSTPLDSKTNAEFVPSSNPRNYNDYKANIKAGTLDDSKYYGVALKWSNTKGYREMSPALSGTVSSECDESVELKYAYRKQFRAGDLVSVYSPGNINGSEEKYGLIIPIIKYYMPDETLEIKDVDAKYFSDLGEFYVNVTTVLGNYSQSRKVTAIYALYDDNGALSGVAQKSQDAMTTSDEFAFTCSALDAAKVKFLNVKFVDNAGTEIASKKATVTP